MERVFSVEEIQDPFWGPSPAAATGIGIGGSERSFMNRSPSEWYFEKFLEEVSIPTETSSIPSAPPDQRPDSTPKPLPIRDPQPIHNSNASGSSFVPSSSRKDGIGGGSDGGKGAAQGEQEVAEIKGPHPPATVQPLQIEPSASADPEEYAAYLKQKLDMCCAAVAKSWGLQESS